MHARLFSLSLSLSLAGVLFGAAPLALAQDAPPPTTPSGPAAGPPGTPQAPPGAAAQASKVDEAKAHYRRARELYDENNFRGALVEMQRAYDLSQNQRLLYDLGQIYFQLQDYPGALNAFTRYLASNKGDIPQQRVDDVQRDIDKLKARIGTLRIVVNRPGAQILVDDVPVGNAPLAEPVFVGAGRHKIAALVDGQTSAPRMLDIAGGDTADVSLTFADVGRPVAPVGPVASETTTPVEKRGVGAAVIVPWVITGGLAVATAVTGAIALSRSSQLSTDLGTAGTTRATLDADGSSTKSMALASDVLLGCTLAAATTSIILTVVNHRSTSTAAPQTGQLSLKVGVGRLGVAGSF